MQGFIQHTDDPQQQRAGGFGFGGGGAGGVSIFEMINQKLLGLGVPRFNAGPYAVEPIASVGFVLAGLVFGLPGLGFAALLFIIVKTSQGRDDRAGNSAPSGGGGGGGRGFQGGGQRLGRS